MQQEQTASRIAQAASTFGAAILGAGAGSGFGSKLKAYSLWIIIIGAIIPYLRDVFSADEES
ncbi:MAG TPA: hypothetical protein VMZ03_07780 [Chitinophagaceae bacterium]|nr:hypothetical protein [Chitinophagaceae bacterium]